MTSQFISNINHPSIIPALVSKWIADTEPAYMRFLYWGTASKFSVPEDFTSWMEAKGDGYSHYLLRRGETAIVNVETGVEPAPIGIRLSVFAETEAEVEDIVAIFQDRLPKYESPKDKVVINFSVLTPTGVSNRSRSLAAPKWEQVKYNYPASTQAELESLINYTPTEGSEGKLILFHGPAGTGKSWSLRALVQEWRDWCTATYVVDPDSFFGSSPWYMAETLLSSSEPEPNGEQWRLFIFEDTGEMLAADAKDRLGQGLARLLNLVDGLLGQGLKILCLITTNEELGKMHPAVTRYGRCLAEIGFETFSAREAKEWMERHEASSQLIDPGNYALADLYAKLHGHVNTKPERQVGFVASNGVK